MIEVHIELLLGKRVRDRNGRVVGRIEEIQARLQGHDYFVEEYHLGPAAFLEKLGISGARMIGFHAAQPTRIPWDKLDLSDPERPRFLGTKEELKVPRHS